MFSDDNSTNKNNRELLKWLNSENSHDKISISQENPKKIPQILSGADELTDLCVLQHSI